MTNPRLELDDGPDALVVRWSPTTLDDAWLDAIEQLLDRIEVDRPLLLAGAPGAFLVSAPPQPPLVPLIDQLRRARAIVDRIAERPVAAFIEGTASGIGAELALACRRRAMRSNARIVLDSVGSGVPAGAHACTMLPGWLGLADALTCLLRGDPINAARAEQVGLARLSEEAPDVVEWLAGDLRRPRRRRHLPWWLRAAERFWFCRRAIFAASRRALDDAGARSLAAVETLRLVERGTEGHGPAHADADAALDRVMSSASGIAALHIGHLRRSAELDEPIITAVALGNGPLPESPQLRRVDAWPSGGPALRIDLRSDATPERGAASNRAGSWRCAAVAGLHVLPTRDGWLWEVVRGITTPVGIADDLARLGRQVGARVICSSGDHFYAARLLGRWLRTALHLLERGAAGTLIDAASKERGFPGGPLACCDVIGLPATRELLAGLAAVAPELAPPQWLDRWIDDGRVGQRSGRGIFRWRRGSPQLDASAYEALPEPSRCRTPALGDRLLWPVMLEAVRAVQAGELCSADADLGALLAVGFPPTLGGPLFHLDTLGAAKVCETLATLREMDGDPRAGLVGVEPSSARYFPTW